MWRSASCQVWFISQPGHRGIPWASGEGPTLSWSVEDVPQSADQRRAKAGLPLRAPGQFVPKPRFSSQPSRTQEGLHFSHFPSPSVFSVTPSLRGVRLFPSVFALPRAQPCAVGSPSSVWVTNPSRRSGVCDASPLPSSCLSPPPAAVFWRPLESSQDVPPL